MQDIKDLCKTWIYPGGEVGTRANSYTKSLLARIQSSNDLINLVMYLNSAGDETESICIPYLPYARQDRKAVAGDPNAVRVLAGLLKTTGVANYTTFDVHSEKSVAAFNYFGLSLENLATTKYFIEYIKQSVTLNRNIHLVSPDEGSRERVSKAVEELYKYSVKSVNTIICEKARDPNTGKLSGFVITYAPIAKPDHIVIVDDICDGGGTFLGIYKVLAEKYGKATPIHLWTTHGIYSKGLDELLENFVTIGSTNSFLHGHVHPRLITIPLSLERT